MHFTCSPCRADLHHQCIGGPPCTCPHARSVAAVPATDPAAPGLETVTVAGSGTPDRPARGVAEDVSAEWSGIPGFAACHGRPVTTS